MAGGLAKSFFPVLVRKLIRNSLHIPVASGMFNCPASVMVQRYLNYMNITQNVTEIHYNNDIKLIRKNGQEVARMLENLVNHLPIL